MTYIAQEVAFAICNPFHNRLRLERYMVAYNSVALKSWDNIAVVQTTKELTQFDDLVCIDYSSVFSNEFREKHPEFIKLLLYELKLLGSINYESIFPRW